MVIRRCYKRCALLTAVMFHWRMLIRWPKHFVPFISSASCWQWDSGLCLFGIKYSSIKWLLPCHSTELRNCVALTACYLKALRSNDDSLWENGKMHEILILLLVLNAHPCVISVNNWLVDYGYDLNDYLLSNCRWHLLNKYGFLVFVFCLPQSGSQVISQSWHWKIDDQKINS